MADLALGQRDRRLGLSTDDDGTEMEEVFNTFGQASYSNPACVAVRDMYYYYYNIVGMDGTGLGLEKPDWHSHRMDDMRYEILTNHDVKYFDLIEWHQPVDASANLTCPGHDSYYVPATNGSTPDSPGQFYCSNNNIDVMYSQHEELVNNGCYQKCGPRVGDYKYHFVNMSGTNFSSYYSGAYDKIKAEIDNDESYCAGNSLNFTAETNALCLPRERCEELCTMLGADCHSIDMHRVLPRCYLNTPSCGSDVDHVYASEYDMLVKMTTPAEDDAVDDERRDTYTTITGHTAVASETMIQDMAPRWACEFNCSYGAELSSWCMGFVFESYCDVVDGPFEVGTATPCVDIGKCTYLSKDFEVSMLNFSFDALATPVNPNLQIQTVRRNKFEHCFVDFAAPDPTLTDTYYKSPEYPDVFLQKSNMSRIRFTNEFDCVGWVVEKHSGSTQIETLENCTDDAVAASHALFSLGMPEPMDSGLTYVCQTLYDEGACMYGVDVREKYLNMTAVGITGDDFTAIIRSLCSNTCIEPYTEIIGKQTYYVQDTNTSKKTPLAVQVGASDTSCYGDDNVGAKAFLTAFVGTEGFLTVGQMAAIAPDYCFGFSNHTSVYNTEMSPCHFHPWQRVWASICTDTCSTMAAPFTTTTPAPTPDERSPTGALYGNRRLFAVDRGPEVTEVHWVDGFDFSGGSVVYNSWSNGSWDANSLYADELCNLNFAATIEQQYYDEISTSKFYDVEIDEAKGLNIARVCRTAPDCPQLTTCILAPMRFSEILAEKRGEVARDAFVTTSSMSALERFIPQVLITDARAEAHIVAAKFEMTASVYRNVPGAMTLKFPTHTHRGQFGDLTVVALAPSTADLGKYAETEFGRTYESPKHYTSWVTDVIRVERFSEHGGNFSSFSASPFYFEIYAGVPDLSMFYMDGDVPVNILTVGGSVVPLGAGYFGVTVPAHEAFAAFDLVGASDVDDCTEDLCDPNAVCANMIGKPAVCTCATGYVGDGMKHGDGCALEQHSYDPKNLDYYLRLYHKDKLDFGWRVREIKMYEDEKCEGPVVSSGLRLKYPAPPECFNKDPETCVDQTYRKITSVTDVYTGVYAKAHYPGEWWNQYWNGNLFDEQESEEPMTEWWSSSLQLNPELVDGESVTIEWLVSGRIDIKCVKVYQTGVPAHSSHNLVLERGPVVETHTGEEGEVKPGAKCELVQDHQYWDHPTPRCKPTIVVEGMFVGTTATFQTTCGVPHTQIFGEILNIPSIGPGGWYGSYANDVAVISPCQCQALCIQHQAEGCRNWKYYDAHGIKHCYLQSSTFGPGEGYYGTDGSADPAIATGWTSGTIGRRMTGFVADMKPGERFSLAVMGVGMPFSPVKSKSGAPRQRIKIVEESMECKEKIPAEVQGIGCTETEHSIPTAYGALTEKIYTICSTKPNEDASEELAVFDGLKITPSAMPTTYKVCYCAGNCFHPTSYEVLPGSIKVPGSGYLWSTDPEVIERKDAHYEPTVFTLTVQRPLFGDASLAYEWELKVTRNYFGCGVEPETDLVGMQSNATEGAGYTGNMLNPDTVEWEIRLHLEKEDTGKWAVCFRNSASGEFMIIPSLKSKYLEVGMIAADHIHPRGIFHNSMFSTLAGSRGDIKVKGSRLPIPADSRIAISAGGCGAASLAPVTVLQEPSDDLTPPIAHIEEFYPAGDVGVVSQAIVMKFSETITTAGCTGNVSLVPTDWNYSSDMLTFGCDSLTALGDERAMLLPDLFSFNPAVEYTIRLGRDAVRDLAGNSLPFTATESLYSLKIGSNASNEAMVLETIPCNGCESLAPELTILFSKPVSPVVGVMVEVVDCGYDDVCDESDVAVDYFDVTSANVKLDSWTYYATAAAGNYTYSSAKVELLLDNLVTMDVSDGPKKYKVTVPAGAFFDEDDGPDSPAEDLVIIFTRVVDVLPAQHTIAVSESTPDAYTFSLQLPEDVAEDELDVCYCNANDDTTLEVFGDGATTYKLVNDAKCGPVYSLDQAMVASPFLYPTGKRVIEHVCHTKCVAGCTGPYCFCSGYDEDVTDDTLCLSPDLCREACEATGEACLGINIADDKPQCLLVLADPKTPTPAPTPAAVNSTGVVADVPGYEFTCDEREDWSFYQKFFGTACTHAADFKERAGALAVTKRVKVGIDYVLDPGQPHALEVTAPKNPNPDSTGELSPYADRIMVVDCEGVCGVSAPSRALEGDTSVRAWANLAPTYDLSDSDVLHFPGVTFKSGGTFKLCFCDSVALGKPCERAADFAIEVGTVHSSGVSCLVSQPKLQRTSCVPQQEGAGLRCYEDAPLFPDFAARRLDVV
jgi:hypothetical protein